jgi:hypothetical protein
MEFYLAARRKAVESIDQSVNHIVMSADRKRQHLIFKASRETDGMVNQPLFVSGLKGLKTGKLVSIWLDTSYR